MDITRASRPTQRRRRRIIIAVLLAGIVPLGFAGVAQLKPAAPGVARSTIWIDTVRRGTMLRQVRGMGTLVSEGTWWIPATTDARVERILVQPGMEVTANTLILELSNPELEQEALETEWGLKAAIAQLHDLEVRLQGEKLDHRAVLATIKAQNDEAQLLSQKDRTLNAKGLSTTLETAITRNKADELDERYRIEKERIGIYAESVRAQLAVQRSRIEQLRALAALKRSRVESLHVRAGIDGVLQQLPVQVGQHIIIGTTLAKVAQQGHLKAELRVAETQAKDIQTGQEALIDTRNGTVAGHVSRIDPAVQNGTVTVDVLLDGTLPRGARPDLSVDGTIELERLRNVLYIGRPTQGIEGGSVGLFRVSPDGREAVRVPVKLGRSSVTTVEVAGGLREGDRIILSDMTAWDGHDRIELQ